MALVSPKLGDKVQTIAPFDKAYPNVSGNIVVIKGNGTCTIDFPDNPGRDFDPKYLIKVL